MSRLNRDQIEDLPQAKITGLVTELAAKADASALTTHVSDVANPHATTKAQVGLANADNTSDAAKPVSAAQQTALDLKANLADPTFTGTVAGVTKAMVGLANVDNTTDASKPVSAAQQTALDLKANLAGPTFTGTVAGITKAMVGLANVDNTADASKPVSAAQLTALNLKANLADPTFTGTVAGVTAAMVGLGAVNNTSDLAKPVSTAQQTALDLKANLAGPTFTGTVAGITKAMVGLANVDNTTDAAKPVSTAQQTALNLKANLAGPTFTGTVSGITAAMVGLGAVNNTSDLAKPVSTAQQTALDLKANLISPVLVTPNIGTPSAGVLTNATGLPIAGISATGTRNATTFLRGDGTFAVPAGGGGGGAPGGATTELQFNDGGVFAGDADLTWDSATNVLALGGVNTGVLLAAVTDEPPAPGVDWARLYAKNIGGRMSIKTLGASGVDTPLQNAFWGNNIVMWNTTTATAGVWLSTAGAGSGTYSTAPRTFANLYTTIKRGRYAGSANTANQILGQRNTETMFYRGAGVGGGFFFFARMGFDLWADGGRFFAGMHTATTVVTSDPSAHNNAVGFCVDAADNGAISFLTRGTTATKDPTGFTIEANKGYDLVIFCAPGSTQYTWRIRDINLGTEATGIATETLPGNVIFQTAGVLASNAALAPATQIQLGVNRIYVETDF